MFPEQLCIWPCIFGWPGFKRIIFPKYIFFFILLWTVEMKSAWLSSDQCSIVIVLFLKRFQESLCLTNNIAFLVNTNYDTLCSSNRLCFTCRKLLSWVNFSDSLQTKLFQMFFWKIKIMFRELTLRTEELEPRASIKVK